jgi:hypothetical protein
VKPQDPHGDACSPLLGALQLTVIGFPLNHDLASHVVEPPWTALGLRKYQISDGAGDTAIAIFERVDRQKS